MVLCDAGPLIAAIDSGDPYHRGTVELIAALGNQQLITTGPCLTEAFYFLHKFGGWSAQKELGLLLQTGGVAIDSSLSDDLPRIMELMEQYRDAPMDFADASLIAVAERLGISRVLTIDHHFYGYRLANGNPFDILFPQRSIPD